MVIRIMYVTMSMGCRTNGLSNQWAVGPMCCRTNGLSTQWAVGPTGSYHFEMHVCRCLGIGKHAAFSNHAN